MSSSRLTPLTSATEAFEGKPDMTDTITTPTTQGVLLTDVAAAKVKSLLEAEGRDDLVLRIAVQPGGCSGLRYQLELDDRSFDGDVVSEFGGVKVAVDKMSATAPERRLDRLRRRSRPRAHDRQLARAAPRLWRLVPLIHPPAGHNQTAARG